MNIRRLSTSVTAGLLTFGLAAFAPASGSAQTVFPEKSANLTVTGCFLQMTVNENGKQKEEFVLARPIIGSLESVPEATCTSTGNDQAIEVEHVQKHPHKHHVDSSMVGRWYEMTGELEKVENSYELRELNVGSFRLVPVVPPRAAEVAPPAPAPFIAEVVPEPTPEIQPAAPEPAAVATTGELPRTASSLPLTALIGMLALVGAFALRLFAYRPAARRG